MTNILKILTNPKFTIFGIICGPIFGIYFKNAAENFAFIYNVYISLMQMVVIPLIIVTIMIGVLDFSNQSNVRKDIFKIISRVIALFIAVSVISIIIVLIAKPWTSIMNNPELLYIVYKNESIIQTTTIKIDDVIDINGSAISFSDFIASAIPSNVFDSLSKGEILQIIIFFSIVTAAIVSFNKNTTNSLRSTLEELMTVFQKINDAILSVLPILSFFIISYQLHLISIETLRDLLKLVLCIVGLMAAIVIFFIFIIIYRAKAPLSIVLTNIGKCIVLAFLSSSTLISTGLVVEVMAEELKFEKDKVQLIVPIGAGILRFGTLSIYIISAILAACFFNKTLGYYEYAMLTVFSIFATFVSISANSSLAFYQTLSIAMNPLGLPSSSIQTIMISIDFLIAPLLAVANVIGITALCALYCKNNDEIQATNALVG